MDLVLIRKEFRKDGIFGELLIEKNGELLAHTLEHAYEKPAPHQPSKYSGIDSVAVSGEYAPKLIEGSYTCVRGMHRLKSMVKKFETFEITKVPGHTGILFHIGNFNEDSSGCVLLGHSVIENSGNGIKMIGGSREAFNRFMRLQGEEREFTLTVR
jgi:hypothetical protein